MHTEEIGGAQSGDSARPEVNQADLDRIVATVRQDLTRRDCPAEYIHVACESVERAAGGVARTAEARERKRIIRWLRSVADVYAARFRSGRGEESAYWSDQLKAFSQAADGISRRRHKTPH